MSWRVYFIPVAEPQGRGNSHGWVFAGIFLLPPSLFFFSFPSFLSPSFIPSFVHSFLPPFLLVFLLSFFPSLPLSLPHFSCSFFPLKFDFFFFLPKEISNLYQSMDIYEVFITVLSSAISSKAKKPKPCPVGTHGLEQLF